MTELNSHLFEDIYKELNINLDKFGCIMLDIEPIQGIEIKEKWLYYAKDKDKFWIDGFTFKKIAHLTLLYGLLENGLKWKKYVKQVLDGWELPNVVIEKIGYFDSPYKDEPYYCIVAHVKVTNKLLEGHQRLEFLPHVNTFTGYKPHITLAYIKKDELIRDSIIKLFENMVNYKLPVKEINFGK